MSPSALLYGGPFDGEAMRVLSDTQILGLSSDLPEDKIPYPEHPVHVYELSEHQDDMFIFTYRYATTFKEYSE